MPARPGPAPVPGRDRVPGPTTRQGERALQGRTQQLRRCTSPRLQPPPLAARPRRGRVRSLRQGRFGQLCGPPFSRDVERLSHGPCSSQRDLEIQFFSSSVIGRDTFRLEASVRSERVSPGRLPPIRLRASGSAGVSLLPAIALEQRARGRGLAPKVISGAEFVVGVVPGGGARDGLAGGLRTGEAACSLSWYPSKSRKTST